jgi:hypothetical protein
VSKPFIYFATYSIKPGKLALARQEARAIGDLVREREPRLIAFHLFLNEAAQQMTCVQVHPDSESMATHMAVIAQHLAASWDWLDTIHVEQALGTPPDVLTRYAEEYNEPLQVFGEQITGFTRAAEPVAP